ncbi:MAG TPA: hypothetical protein VHR66_00480 [Gemmataceae bacterium]|nr:hypothetical protein [Gemmataceae bacterium]
MFAVALFTTLTVSVPPADADINKRAAELVAHLGDPSYRDREKAARELLEIGYAARDAVLAGQKSSDTEISDRCKKLYPAIWRHDLEKRVQKFLDQPDGPIADDLPGAARWIKITGDGKESRKLYAEMVKADPETLLDIELNPERLRQAYLDLVRNAYRRNLTRSTAPSSTRSGVLDSEVLLFLFLGAAGDVRPMTSAGVSASYYYQFLNATYLNTQLADEANKPMRRLYAAWLEKERYSLVLRRGIDTAATNKVHECAPVLLKIVTDPTSLPTSKSAAIVGFGRIGTKDDLPALAEMLKDKSLAGAVAINGEVWKVQVRDVALGAAVQLAGLNPDDFGLEHRHQATGLALSSLANYAFASDEKREAAHQKWKEWTEKNLKK